MEDFALQKRKKQNGYWTMRSQKDVNRFCEEYLQGKIFVDILKLPKNSWLFCRFAFCFFKWYPLLSVLSMSYSPSYHCLQLPLQLQYVGIRPEVLTPEIDSTLLRSIRL